MDTELRHLEIVGFVDFSYAEAVALLGPPARIRGCAAWLREWNGREFLITDGTPPAEKCSGDYAFMVSASDRDAGCGFVLYLQDAIYCARLTQGMALV